jgi:hypothetical protein
MSASLDGLPTATRAVWLRLRDELEAALGNELIAIWAYGSSVAPDPPGRPADLDAHVVVSASPNAETARRIETVLDAIARDADVEWDVWVIGLDDARRPMSPPHAYHDDRRDTSWAIHRAHWLAGSVVNVHGREPAEIVAPPRWSEVEVDLDLELEHIERHVAEGDTDPDEAAYAILNGSRILRAIETKDAVLTKRDAGRWALDHLADRWHPAIRAALRAYDADASPEDAELLAAEMAPFVAVVRSRLPMAERAADHPRWSGY